MSNGEEKIFQLLKDNNISFIPEYRDKQCILSTNGIARFDFYVNNQYFIEYDGEQHYDCKHHGWNDEQGLIATQQRDKEKNQYCLQHDIPLIRIPYWHYKNLCIEDLKLETSHFIYKGENNAE